MKRWIAASLALIFYASILPWAGAKYFNTRHHNIVSDGGNISGFDNGTFTGRVSAPSIGSASHTDNGYFNDLITGGPWVDVRKWGFTTDNTAANNVTAWNNNIAAGMNVLIPAGTFNVDTTSAMLNIPDNVMIRGMGMGLTWVKNTASVRARTFSNTDQTNGNQNITMTDFSIERTVLPGSLSDNWNEFVRFSNGGGAGTSGKNITVDRMHFYSAAAATGLGDKAILFHGVKGFTVTNCIFDADVDVAVTAADSTGVDNTYSVIAGNRFFSWGTSYSASAIVSTQPFVNIIGNIFKGNSTNSQGIELGETATNNNIIGNTFHGKSNFLVAVTSESDLLVANNVIKSYGTTSQGANIALSADDTKTSSRISVKSNKIYNGIIYFNTINAGTFQDVSVSGNEVYYGGPNDGLIRFGKSGSGGVYRNVSAKNNTAAYGNKAGIYANGTFYYLTIDGNEIYNNGQSLDGSYQHGLFFESVSGGPFFVNNNKGYDNQAVATQKWGFQFSGTPTIDSFVGNIARGNITSQLLLGSETYLTKYGNKFSGGASNGRAVLSSGTVTVSTAEVLASDSITLTRVVGGGTGRGHSLEVGTTTAGTSFVINSVDNAASVVTTDNSTVYWEIRH